VRLPQATAGVLGGGRIVRSFTRARLGGANSLRAGLVVDTCGPYAAARAHHRPARSTAGFAGLAGTYFFVRFGRYAETDILAAFFVTAAIAAIINGALARRRSQKNSSCISPRHLDWPCRDEQRPAGDFSCTFLVGLAVILRHRRFLPSIC